MREVPDAVRGLLRHRGFLAAWLLLCAGSTLLTQLPLMNLPGYELAAALALLHGVVGGPFGIAAIRLQRRADPTPTPPLLPSILATVTLLWLALVPAFITATALALATTPCSPFATVEFFPILTLPSSLVSVSLGGLVARWLHRGWAQALGWLGVLALCALHTAWPLVFGPQAFAYNHLGGYLPGPIYDEELHVPLALVSFRLGTLTLAVHALSHLERPSRRARLVLAASALLFLALEAAGPTLGFRMNDAALAERLGGLRETKELILHFPRGTEPAEVDRMLGDAQFRFAQITRFFGATPPGTVTIWWYESPAQKRRLVGAAHTQFAKPWRREVHIHSMGFPHPVLKHELVHALAAPWGAPPFGVTATWLGLKTHIGVVEGMAVAADNPVDELTLFEWAAAMKRRGLLPDVRVLLMPTGFYAAPASRAYVAAGSFLRFLTQSFGAERTRRLYRDGDFEAAFGRPLSELATDYERFLDEVPLDEAAVSQALDRFRRGSIFERPCAREAALLVEAASHAPAASALPLWRRCRALQPAEPRHVLAEARALAQLDRADEAAASLDAELQRLDAETSPWTEAALLRAELALSHQEPAAARTLLGRVLARSPSPTVERTAAVRLAALDAPPAAQAAVRLFFDGSTPEKLAALRAESAGGGWLVQYLLGRSLHKEGAWAEAQSWLERAELDPQCPPAVAREAHRLALEAAFGSEDCAAVRRLASTGRFGPAFDARAADWSERCDFLGGREPLLHPGE
jgi:tetratricopeptide (TPR) repeat protein